MRGGDTATFVLGDIVGSTRMWAEATEAMPDALGSLDAVVDAGVERHGGERPAEQGEGDSFLVVFPVASSAVAFALEVQRALSEQPITVRIGVHTGDALQRDDGRWMGQSVNRAARLRDVANGGQILVSGVTSELVVEALPHGAWLKDLGSHRLKDLARSEHVRQLCHADLESDFPPLRSLDKLPHNLPVELDSFVGREAELEAIDELLDKGRLVTLTGAGGCGKTRLAIHAAAAMVDRLPGGAWLADLAPVADPSLVPKVVATALELREYQFQSLADSVVARLSDQTALVVLDNCEHLLNATTDLADRLLRNCPGVLVIATSREPLGVEGELVYRVPSMALPIGDDDADSESVNLFVERARAVRPTFTLDATTLPAVTALCRRVDGLPLAIELAAARCRAMSPVEIAAQLSDQFDLLSAGRRVVLPRQRTLEASVEWSHDLLSDGEQRLLRRLSAFAGGFDLAGAECVGSGGDIDAWQIVDLLTGLVDKSLVQAEETDGRTRYRLLETIRVFAARRLADAGEVPMARDRHLEHMISVGEAFEAEMNGRGRLSLYLSLRPEVDNLRAALDWAIEQARARAAWRLAAATDMFWVWEFPGEWRQRVSSMLPLEACSPIDRVAALVKASFCCMWAADFLTAETFLEEADRVAGDDARLNGWTKNSLAYLRMFQGDPAAATELFDRAVSALEPAGADFYLIDALMGRAMLFVGAGRLKHATQAIAETIDAARGTGNEFLICLALFWVAFVALFAGSFAEATAAYAEIERLGWGGRSNVAIDSFVGMVPAWIRSASGEHDQAVELADEVLAAARRYMQFAAVSLGGWLTALVSWRAGRPLDEPAIEEAERADALVRSGTTAWLVAIRAEHALASGDLPLARELSERSVEQARSSSMSAGAIMPALRTRARVALASGDPGGAEVAAHQVLEMAHEEGARFGLAEIFETLAATAAALDSDTEAARLLGAAEAIRTRIGWVPGVPEVAELERLTHELRERIGSETYESAFAEGRALSIDEAVAYAQRGRGARKRPSFGWDSLTPAERDVTELAAQGLRNAQIAEKLFVSPATVKTHLTHVFSRLGVRTRAELAAEAARHGL